MDTKITGAVLVVVLIAGAGWYFTSKNSVDVEPAPIIADDGIGESSTTGTMPAIQQTIAITYTDEGYSPAEVTIPAGSTVTWTNKSSKQMWVASAMHPSHVAYDGTAKDEHCKNNAPTSDTVFDECTGDPTGSSWSFTFTKVGSWKYHDHITASKYGSITVTEASTEVSGADGAAI